MVKKLALLSLIVACIFGIAIVATYAFPMPNDAIEQEHGEGVALVTLEITRLGQKTFQVTKPENQLMKMINHDTGQAYGFIPRVVDHERVSVDFIPLRYDSTEDNWYKPEPAEPLEALVVSSRGPSFTTTAAGGPHNYRLELVSIRYLENDELSSKE